MLVQFLLAIKAGLLQSSPTHTVIPKAKLGTVLATVAAAAMLYRWQIVVQHK